MLDVLASCTRRSEEGRPPLAPTRRRWRLRSLWSWERRAHQGSRPPCGRSAGRSGWPTASRRRGGWSTPNTDLDAIMTWVIGCCPPAPPRPRCGCCCSRCGCWMHRRRGARRLQDEHCGSGSTTPYSIAGHSDTHVSVTSKMYVLLQSVHLLDAQTSQFAPLQDEHCGSVSTRPYSVAGHAETHGPATSRMWVLLQTVHMLDGQTSQSASLQDKPCRSVSTTPYSLAGHAETRVPATSKM